MKIAYYIHWDISVESGILKKINAQIRAWMGYGHTVKLFALSFGNNVWSGLDGIPLEWIYCPNIPSRFIKTQRLVGYAINWDPDLIYLRFNFFYPGQEKLHKNNPVIVEVNTDDISEYRLLSKIHYIYNLLTRDRLFLHIDGFTMVSNQFLERFSKYPQPKIVIGNGIDLSQFHNLPVPKSDPPHMLFLGYPNQPWNGIKNILWLSRHLPDWHFDLVGIENPKDGTSDQSNITFHGFLEKEQYQTILETANIAIGTLALYRINLNERSTLKLGEYLASGIPTIIAYHDTNFPTPKSFLLQIPNTPDNVKTHFESIVSFIDEWKHKRVPRDEIADLDIHVKESQRLDFFSKIVELHHVDN